MSDNIYWIWLSRTGRLSGDTALKYLACFSSVRELYLAGEKEYRRVQGAKEAEITRLLNKSLDEASKIEEKCRLLGVKLLCIADEGYPERLRNIYNPPAVLYVLGSLPDVDNNACFAIVGTRRASEYGVRCARRMGRDIASQGGIVVSGLAEGIDSSAMKAAIDAGGTVIGVLGTGIDVVYPAWNGELQRESAKSGAVISEYPPGTKGSKITFPQRNRIISGLSVGVLVVEAPERSGALITASRAIEQGRDVFVVPGEVDNPGFSGSNMLIKDGAALITDAWEMLSGYQWLYPEKLHKKNERTIASGLKRENVLSENDKHTANAEKKSVDKGKSKIYIDLIEAGELSENEKAVLLALLDGAEQTEDILEKTGMDVSEALSTLTMLELMGYIRINGRQRFEVIY